MQSYVGRDSKAHATRRLNAPVDRRISAARTNVIVCLVNISWSAEKRDDTCSKTVSVLLLPANNEAEERANGVGDLFRCKFRKRMPAAFFNSAGLECTRVSRWNHRRRRRRRHRCRRRWKSHSMWRCTRDLADYALRTSSGDYCIGSSSLQFAADLNCPVAYFARRRTTLGRRKRSVRYLYTLRKNL